MPGMNTRRRRLAILMVMAITLVPAAALAQSSAPLPAGPTLTLTTGTVTMLSLLAGLLTSWIQTGTLLGRWVTPKTWLPDLTMASTALGGFLGYVLSQNPVSLTPTTLFYATVASVTALIAGAAPAAALHAHGVFNAQRLQALTASAARATGVLLLIGLIASSQMACSGPLFPTIQKIEQVVLADLQAHKSPAQIDADVCTALGGSSTTAVECAGVTTLVLDAIDLLEVAGVIPPGALPFAQSYRVLHPRASAPAIALAAPSGS